LLRSIGKSSRAYPHETSLPPQQAQIPQPGELAPHGAYAGACGRRQEGMGWVETAILPEQPLQGLSDV
jgi:hypothetical protein